MNMRSRGCLAALVLVSPALAEIPTVLQYFESRWETIEHRMPDIFAAGYSSLWLPPPSYADSGGFSVGYDVFDGFDLGTPARQTIYGTELQVRSLVNEAHRAGLDIYFDLVLNHRGFRDHSTPGFEAGGGYPGFATFLTGVDSFGDFNIPSASDRIGQRISGLIDIAQQKNYVYYRHPAFASSQNLPFKPVRSTNRMFYPDRNLTPNSLGIYPFNLSDPMQGDPVLENATGVLLRNTQWLLEVIGADGFRIDAQKHIPEWFFTNLYDNVVWQRGRTALDGTRRTPLSFGEVFDGDWGILAGYIRKDGFGNRDVLDFPLFFALRDQLSGTGFGVWSTIVTQTIDASDGGAQDGTRGVSFTRSHDSQPGADDNLGHAFILTKPNLPVVYFNAGQFGSRPFPQPGRGDALGGQFGTIVTKLVDIRREYGRDAWVQRWLDNDVLVYERNNNLLIGLNDNGDTSTTRFDQRVVQTSFAPGTRLRELTGNAADPAIDPTDQISDVLTVAGDRRVTIRVPRNINRKGYVMYGPVNPAGTLAIEPLAGTIAADPVSVPVGQRRITPVPIVTTNSFQIRLQTTDPDPLDPDDDDRAQFKIDGGGDFNGNGRIDFTSGASAGYEDFLTQSSPRYGGGAGLYRQQITATGLDEGYHYLRVIAFRHRASGEPIFQTWSYPFYLDRTPPAITLAAPTVTGTADITGRSQTVRVLRADRTATRVHVIPNVCQSADILSLVSPANQASRYDANEFRWTWDNIDAGNQTLAIVAYEVTGNVSISFFAGIRADNGYGAGPGDINHDNQINFNDISPFVQALVAGCNPFDPAADINADGRVDFNDLDPFVTCLVLGCD